MDKALPSTRKTIEPQRLSPWLQQAEGAAAALGAAGPSQPRGCPRSGADIQPCSVLTSARRIRSGPTGLTT